MKLIEPTGSPVSKFADIRQSDVDPDNDVLLCVGDGIEQYFFQTLLAAVFPYPDHEEALRKCMAGSLSFKAQVMHPTHCTRYGLVLCWARSKFESAH